MGEGLTQEKSAASPFCMEMFTFPASTIAEHE